MCKDEEFHCQIPSGNKFFSRGGRGTRKFRWPPFNSQINSQINASRCFSEFTIYFLIFTSLHNELHGNSIIFMLHRTPPPQSCLLSTIFTTFYLFLSLLWHLYYFTIEQRVISAAFFMIVSIVPRWTSCVLERNKSYKNTEW